MEEQIVFTTGFWGTTSHAIRAATTTTNPLLKIFREALNTIDTSRIRNTQESFPFALARPVARSNQTNSSTPFINFILGSFASLFLPLCRLVTHTHTRIHIGTNSYAFRQSRPLKNHSPTHKHTAVRGALCPRWRSAFRVVYRIMITCRRRRDGRTKGEEKGRGERARAGPIVRRGHRYLTGSGDRFF